MVSFNCEGCNDVVKKNKLDFHRSRCHAPFTCIDCSTTFSDVSYRAHTSCISEAEKYQKHLAPKKATKAAQQVPKLASSAPLVPPISLISQLAELQAKIHSIATENRVDVPKPSTSRKRKAEVTNEDHSRPPKKEKCTLKEWSKDKLDSDRDRCVLHAMLHVLKTTTSPLALRDLRKQTMNLIKEHPLAVDDKFFRKGHKKAFDRLKFSLQDGKVVMVE